MFIALSWPEAVKPVFCVLTSNQRARLAKFGGREISRRCSIFPKTSPTGFGIRLDYGDGGLTADFGGLVQDFSCVDEALDWVERCSTADYRLRVDYAGKQPYLWSLERQSQDGKFSPALTAGQSIPFGWAKRKSVRIFKN